MSLISISTAISSQSSRRCLIPLPTNAPSHRLGRIRMGAAKALSTSLLPTGTHHPHHHRTITNTTRSTPIPLPSSVGSPSNLHTTSSPTFPSPPSQYQYSTTTKRYNSGSSVVGRITPSALGRCGGEIRRSLSLATAAEAPAAYDQTVDAFPSIVIGTEGVYPQGPFAEAQAQFLEPDEESIQYLTNNITTANMGVVAHYYMDVELQGVLTSVSKHQALLSPNSPPRIAIADSLKMGDDAVKMCQSGATSIACLGVDFMSESVATIMARNGFGHIPVYRAVAKHIGCSLAESAERDSYRAWLERGRERYEFPLHVVYINTSLETKAVSSSVVPTITCTSSNVMATLLQASVELPEVKIMYGPDTYMGRNLVTMFTSILDAGWSDERIRRDLHPGHNRDSLRNLRDNIDVFPNGNCVVHHMFGNEVVKTVKNYYEDAYVTAHLEVPGEMFEIAMEKSLQGKGVVGSTSDILTFISKKVQEAVSSPTTSSRRLQFVLGTEAGMVTSIVKSLQDILRDANNNNNPCLHPIEAEIVFPVSSEAVMGVDDSDLGVVPGVAGGEGCSTAGGCATCPFMKMNDLDALNDIAEMVIEDGDDIRLKAHLPPNRLVGKTINGVDAIELGSEPIMFMRHFMQNKVMDGKLMERVKANSTI